MITYKPIIIQGGRRKDGTWPVKIRITFKGVSRRLPTTIVCRDTDLTRSGRIKNAGILDKASELITRMRAVTDTLSPFLLEEWNVDDIVNYIREAMTAQTFRLDFFDFGHDYAKGKGRSTAAGYVTALNAFSRFLGSDRCDINSITRGKVLEFMEYIDREPKMQLHPKRGYIVTDKPKVQGNASSNYAALLGHIFAAARLKYNDEDVGRILIPRTPFDGIRKVRNIGQGQRNLGVEVMQRAIDATPESPLERLSLDILVISFACMGVNLADMYAAKNIDVGAKWRYNRMKTGCEVICYIPQEIEPRIQRVRGLLDNDWWLCGLHNWRDASTADKMVNLGLRRWAEREGIEPFTFYAARHTWASIARKQLRIEKATIDEALGHKGDFRITDIYAERNWELARDANTQVLSLFKWL